MICRYSRRWRRYRKATGIATSAFPRWVLCPSVVLLCLPVCITRLVSRIGLHATTCTGDNCLICAGELTYQNTHSVISMHIKSSIGSNSSNEVSRWRSNSGSIIYSDRSGSSNGSMSCIISSE